ncbi:MAG: hypothetical protein JSR33_08730 [Proteobacteria bacterium]|nr:hypothetical protein [Pseudomonadota bacterium]
MAFYEKNKNRIVISRAFKACHEPLTYSIKLGEDSDFGIKTKFLSTGDLQLDYEAPNGKDILRTIHLNYDKLFGNCG